MSAVLNTVYNNYLTAYSPRQLPKYDTHNKSELRSVYNSIIKLNKDAPWYLPTTSKDTQYYAVDVKENARELHNSIAQLGGLEQDGMFRKKSAYSTNNDIAEVTYIGSEAASTASPEFDLEVRALATPQENLGYFLPDLATTLAPDTYSFDIAVNDMNYEFQFNINEGDTNRQIMERLSRLINNAYFVIRAEVAESDSRYALRLTSDATGIPNGRPYHFRVSDDHTSKTSGVVDNMGLNYISHSADNASFLINGEERSSSSKGARKSSTSIPNCSEISKISVAVGFVSAIQQPSCGSCISWIEPSIVLKILTTIHTSLLLSISPHTKSCPASLSDTVTFLRCHSFLLSQDTTFIIICT